MESRRVKSRKVRFWAFLLSFVLTVGVLPVHIISAGTKYSFSEGNADPDGFGAKPLVSGEDTISNANVNIPGMSPVTNQDLLIIYKDHLGAVLNTVRLTMGSADHTILTYAEVLPAGTAGDLAGHISDLWNVSSVNNISPVLNVFKEIELTAVPKYTIDYDKNGGTFGVLPAEYIPGITGDINLTSTGSLTGSKIGNSFAKWDGVLPADSGFADVRSFFLADVFLGDWPLELANIYSITPQKVRVWDLCDTIVGQNYNIKLKAIFDPNDYQIVLNTNLGTASTTSTLPTDGTWIKYGANTANVNLTTPASDASKTFKGWALKADATAPDAFCTFDANNNVNPAKLDDIVNVAEAVGSGATIRPISYYTPETPATPTTPAIPAQSARTTITLYAVWETPTYNVTFDVQGKGTATAPAGQNVAYGLTVAPPAEPTEYGYSLEGWYKEPGCINKWNFATDTVTGARTLYANWVPNDYTVKFDANAPADFSGNPVANPADLTKKFGQNLDITYPALQDGADYEFLGWALENDAAIPDLAITYPSEAKTVKLDDVVKDAESDATIGTTYKSSYNDATTGRNVNIYDLTLYGVWRKKSYTVNFVDGNGTVIGSQVYAYGTPANTVKTYADTLTPTKAEDADYTYTFSKWDKEFTAITSDITYTAMFDATSKNNNNVNNGWPWPSYYDNKVGDDPTPPSSDPENPPSNPVNPPVDDNDDDNDDDDDEEEVYSITYYVLTDEPDLNTGNPATYVAGVGCKIPNGVSLANHKFVGWFTARNGGVAVDVITDEDTGDKELYARFDEADDDGKASIFLDDIEGGLVGTPKFSSLMLRLTNYEKNSITLQWGLQKGADGYDIYGSKCNSGGVIRTYEYITTVGGDVDNFVAENLEEATYYKFYIESFVLKPNGEKIIICRSVLVHGTTQSEDYGVADSVQVTEDEITLEVGETYQIQAIEIINDKTKTIRSHRPICYESSNRKVKVGLYTGLVTARRVGKSWVYVYAQNGLYTRVLVNVVAKAEKQ